MMYLFLYYSTTIQESSEEKAEIDRQAEVARQNIIAARAVEKEQARIMKEIKKKERRAAKASKAARTQLTMGGTSSLSGALG